MKPADDNVDMLILRYLDGALDDASMARLNERIESDHYTACRVAELALDHGELRRVFSEDDASQDGVKRNSDLLRFPKVPFWRRPISWAAAAVVLIVLVYAGYLHLGGSSRPEVATHGNPPNDVPDRTPPQRKVETPAAVIKKDDAKKEATPRPKKEDRKNLTTLTGTIAATLSSGNEPKILKLKLSVPDGASYDIAVDRVSSKLGYKYNGKSVSVVGIVSDGDGGKRLVVKSILDEPGDRENTKPKAPVTAQDEDK